MKEELRLMSRKIKFKLESYFYIMQKKRGSSSIKVDLDVFSSKTVYLMRSQECVKLEL